MVIVAGHKVHAAITIVKRASGRMYPLTAAGELLLQCTPSLIASVNVALALNQRLRAEGGPSVINKGGLDTLTNSPARIYHYMPAVVCVCSNMASVLHIHTKSFHSVMCMGRDQMDHQ